TGRSLRREAPDLLHDGRNVQILAVVEGADLAVRVDQRKAIGVDDLGSAAGRAWGWRWPPDLEPANQEVVDLLAVAGQEPPLCRCRSEALTVRRERLRC